MSETLKPCTCGAVPRMTNFESSAIHISCSCGIQLWGAKRHFGSEDEAAAEWNKRHTPAAWVVAYEDDGHVQSITQKQEYAERQSKMAYVVTPLIPCKPL